MVRTRTLYRMQQEPIRFQRAVKSYKRKSPAINRRSSPVQVKEYVQGYNSPRGRIGSVKPDRLTRSSQTIWLMDKQGHFVGRANYEGKTNAQNVSKFGYDETTVVRDTKRYKRVFGRLSQGRRRIIRG
jgi:hypothetical protein